jgi:predicted lactoylglutathione lyase
MTRQLFVNLPIRNIERTRAFFSALGFSFNPRFSNQQAVCMVISDTVSVMLLVEPFFQTFTKLPVADATKSTEVLLALSCDSRAEVDEMVAKAVAAGASTPNAPQDHGFMFQHGFTDLDGHQWEVFWMDESAAPQQF